MQEKQWAISTQKDPVVGIDEWEDRSEKLVECCKIKKCVFQTVPASHKELLNLEKF